MSQTIASALGNRIVTFVSIDGGYNCAICMQVADEPTRCSGFCAGIFCGTCMQQALTRNKSCPVCNKAKITASKDVVLRNQILSKQVYCINTATNLDMNNTNTDRKRKGTSTEKCSWTGNYDDLRAHLNVCEYEIVTCRNDGCNEKIEGRVIEMHHQQCMHRLLRCGHCNHTVKRIAMNNHLLQCPMAKVVCEVIGCNAMMMRRDCEKHQDEAAKHHVRLLSYEVVDMKKENMRLLADVANMKQENIEISEGSNRLTINIARVNQDNARIIQENERLAVTIQSIAKLSEFKLPQVKWRITGIAAKLQQAASTMKMYNSSRFDAFLYGNQKLYMQANIKGKELGLFVYKDIAMSADNSNLDISGTTFTVSKSGLPDIKMTFPNHNIVKSGGGWSTFLADMTPYVDDDGVNVTLDLQLKKEHPQSIILF